MDTYIEKVKDWSERHGEPLERQYPKVQYFNKKHISLN
jgi:hypothetical protein